jgi:hypothetical protein
MDESRAGPRRRSELDVRTTRRAWISGGYEWDDEESARVVKLLTPADAGRLTSCVHATKDGRTATGGARPPGMPPPEVQTSVAGGQTSTAEMARRLGSGLWITDLDRGSVEPVSGRLARASEGPPGPPGTAGGRGGPGLSPALC